MDPSTEHGAGDFDLSAAIGRVVGGGNLSATEAEAAFDRFMAGSASPVQMAALLTALRMREPMAGEVAGGVRALRRAMLPVASEDPDVLVDTAGTGGGSLTTFNISTAAAIVAAATGVKIAKHGNRSFTSRSGSADVLEALGVRIELDADQMAAVLARAGIVFMFAPLLHPAMRHVGPVRRELGFPTVMNLLGPLTNPASARRQVVGVSNPALLELVAGAFRELGHIRALVVHGAPGMDEISPMGATQVLEVDGSEVKRYTVTPDELGVPEAKPEGLAGGEPEDNARVIRAVFAGKGDSSARSAVLVNAAGAIYVGGLVDSLADGVTMAADALDSGAAQGALDALIEASSNV